MRGADQKQGSMLCLLSPEQGAPQNHPLGGIRQVADVNDLPPVNGTNQNYKILEHGLFHGNWSKSDEL